MMSVKVFRRQYIDKEKTRLNQLIEVIEDVRIIIAVYQFLRFKAKKDGTDLSKQKKKNFSTQKRKRSFLSGWYKAVFGGWGGYKKSRDFDGATFLIAMMVCSPRDSLRSAHPTDLFFHPAG